MHDPEPTVPLRYAPAIAGIGVTELLILVRDRKLRFVRVDGDLHLYVQELQALQPA